MIDKLSDKFKFLLNDGFTHIELAIEKKSRIFPNLPTHIIDLSVQYGGLIALITGIISISSIMTFFSIGGMFFYTFIPFKTPFMIIYVIGSLLSGIMLITSYNELKNKTIYGWKLLFWSGNIIIVSLILSLNILQAIIWGLMIWYFLVQIRIRYK